MKLGFLSERVLQATVALCVVGGALTAGWQCWHLLHDSHASSTGNTVLRRKPVAGSDEAAEMERARIAALRLKIEKENAARFTAENTIAALKRKMPEVDGQELYSFGRVDQLGIECAHFINAMQETDRNILLDSNPPRAENRILQNFTTQAEALGDLEAVPAKIAQIHAAALQQMLDLDGQTSARICAQIEYEFTQLAAGGLTRPHRPEEDQEGWYQRRDAAVADAAQRVEALVPVANRKPWAVARTLQIGAAFRTRIQTGAASGDRLILSLELPGMSIPLRSSGAK